MRVLPEKRMKVQSSNLAFRHIANNMGWLPFGHTSSSVCKAKNAKNGILKKSL